MIIVIFIIFAINFKWLLKTCPCILSKHFTRRINEPAPTLNQKGWTFRFAWTNKRGRKRETKEGVILIDKPCKLGRIEYRANKIFNERGNNLLRNLYSRG